MVDKDTSRDRKLGMDRAIDRRDFLNGVAMGAAGLSAAMMSGCTHMTAAVMGTSAARRLSARADGTSRQPCGRLRNRAQRPRWNVLQYRGMPRDTDGVYDLVVVGAGISGLSAAYFYAQAKPNARILILDNHDDFGGHAKRNEFMLGGASPSAEWRHRADRQSARLQRRRRRSADDSWASIPWRSRNHPRRKTSMPGLGPGTFFDKETFGADKLVVGGPAREDGEVVDWPAFLAQTPLPETARQDILRIETAMVDHFPGLTSAREEGPALAHELWRLPVEDRRAPIRLRWPYYQKITHDEWGVGIDAEPALDCWGFGFPGFQGLKLDPGVRAAHGQYGGGLRGRRFAVFHFPDGNASIARLLVRAADSRARCPDAASRHRDGARANTPSSTARARPFASGFPAPSSACATCGGPAQSQGVELVYASADGSVPRARRTRACSPAGT